jgi:hypothetical protein
VSGSYGSTLEHRGPFVVRVTSATSRPRISHTPPANTRGTSVLLRAQVEDSAPVQAVRAYYKRGPAWHEWLRVDMKRAVAGNYYEAKVPLTAEGILYYFEAVNADGNATNHPNFLRETPYYVIEARDPAS